MSHLEDNKKYILNEFLEVIFGISNKDYQERVWIRVEGPECDTYDSTINDFFDIGDPIIEDYKSFYITEKQLEILIKLKEEFDEFIKNNYLFPTEFIDSPKWLKIMNLAKEVLDAFDYQHVPFEEQVKELEALNKKRKI